MGAFAKGRLVRKGVFLQPGQQAGGGRADHIGLRIVDVQVDEAWRQDAARQMGDFSARLSGELRLQRLPAAGGDHALLPPVIRGDGQQAVFVVERLAIVGKTQQ
ncbi:MAG: hypothetical protein GAK34_03806 [Delftia tsuruhatensis]|nr:MAG: hypothetical protein GAK34_03806 [Delftia tsuruhatensis]